MGAWLIPHVSSRAIDRLRTLKRFHKYVQTQSDTVNESSVAPNPETLAEHYKVKLAQEVLPENQWLVLELIYFQRLSYCEIVDFCEMPEGTVKCILLVIFVTTSEEQSIHIVV